MKQECGGAVKNSEWKFKLLELNSGPWKEGGWWSHLLCASQANPDVLGLLLDTHSEKGCRILELAQQTVIRIGRERGTSNHV